MRFFTYKIEIISCTQNASCQWLTTRVIAELVSRPRPAQRKQSYLDLVDNYSSLVDIHLKSLEVNYVTSEDEKAGCFMPIEIKYSQSTKVRHQGVRQSPPLSGKCRVFISRRVLLVRKLIHLFLGVKWMLHTPCSSPTSAYQWSNSSATSSPAFRSSSLSCSPFMS